MSHIFADATVTVGRPRPSRLVVRSVAYDPFTLAEAVTYLRDAFTRGVGGRLVLVDRARRAEVGDDATIVLAGSAGAVLASRLTRPSRSALPERIRASRLVAAICAACVADGRRIFLVGGAPGGHGVPSGAQRAAAVLGLRHRGLSIAGCASVPGPDDLIPLVADIVEAKPDVVLIGAGRVLQEVVSTALRGELAAVWTAGVPGAVDQVVGDRPTRRERLRTRFRSARVL
jgi:UDP-N-acetyl-D-mannosaminuronic acid transferase (WecB/TagA/CpsF family)